MRATQELQRGGVVLAAIAREAQDGVAEVEGLGPRAVEQLLHERHEARVSGGGH